MVKKHRSSAIFINLLFALIYRDLTQRYRRSLLGPLWAVLQPFILMVLFNMLHNFVNIPSDGIPYVIFSYSALIPWTFFSNAIIFCGPSIIQNVAIIKKSSMPREVFPLAAVITALIDFLMSFLIFIGMMFWFRIKFSWLMLWIFPLVLLTAFLAFALGMGIAALGTLKRDFIFATPFLLQFLLFLSPVIYPLSSVPSKWKALYILNPMVGIIEGFRNILVKGISPPLYSIAWSLGVSIVVFFVTWSIFKLFSQYFADML
jgi:lipopolysaccharide transport system permease protein